MSEKNCQQRFRDTEKFGFIVQSYGFKGEELGRFLRQYGLSSIEITGWREQMLEGLKEGKFMSSDEKKSLQNRIKLLEEEVRQLKVLNELQKKVQDIRAAGEEEKLNPKQSESKSLNASASPLPKASRKKEPAKK